MTTLADLPEVQEVLRPVTRWTHARKFWLIQAIKRGLIIEEAARDLHALSTEELARWIELHQAAGANGLKSTRIQTFRGGLR